MPLKYGWRGMKLGRMALAVCLCAGLLFLGGCDWLFPEPDPPKLEVEEIVSQVVSASKGGTIVVTEEMRPTLAGFELVIPPDALPADQEIRVGEVIGGLSLHPEGHVSLGYRFSLGPTGLSFKRPCLIRITFPGEVWQPWRNFVTPEDLILMKYDKDSRRWVKIPVQFDARVGVLTAEIHGFSIWDVVLSRIQKNPASDEKIRVQARRWRPGEDVRPRLGMQPFLDHKAYPRGSKTLDTTFAQAIGVLLLAEAMWDRLKDGNFHEAVKLAEVVLKTLPKEVLIHWVAKQLALSSLGTVSTAVTLIVETLRWFLEVMSAAAFNAQLRAYLSWRGWFFEGGTWTYNKDLAHDHDVVIRGVINDSLIITSDEGWFIRKQLPTGAMRSVDFYLHVPPGGNPKVLFEFGKVLYDFLHKVHRNELEKDREWLKRAFRGENSRPTVSITGPDSAVSVGQKVTLQATVKDDENDPMVWEWVQTAGPVVELDYRWQLETSFTPTEPGVYSFKLKVWDTLVENLSTATITITVSGPQTGRPPSATTGQATNITATSATLNATVNPNGLATSVYFEWGTSPTYGNRTPTQSIGSGTSNVSVSANLTGLSPNTAYYFRVVARNSAGTTRGLDSSFQTSSLGGIRPNFDISIDPASIIIRRGASGKVTITVTRNEAMKDPVDLTVEGIPIGVKVTVDPARVPAYMASATMRIEVGPAVEPRNYTLTIRGTGSGVTKTATFTLIIESLAIPVRGQIAFVSYRDGKPEIYVMNADGSNVRQLTYRSTGDAPTWSPCGTKIAVVLRRDGNSDIYIMNPDGTNQRNLTNHPAGDGSPIWSPCGTKIAFVSWRDGNLDIYVMNPDGTNQRNLTNHPATDHHPAWSPCGTKIAFLSDRDGNMDIYVMNADGTNQRRHTRHPTEDWMAAWSPDKTKIAFAARPHDGNNVDIYVMNADGTNERNITNHPAMDYHPTWSPCSTKIAFVSDRDGNYEIYVMNADGSNVRRLTNHPARDHSPAWSPVP